MIPPISSTPVPRCIREVHSFEELAAARLDAGVNAVCWRRTLAGDFAEVVAKLEPGEGITNLSEERLRALTLSPAGMTAVETMLADWRRLRDRGLAPELNCIRAYPRDEEPLVVATDVYSYHADSAPFEADTWLCTYHGAASEGLAIGDTVKKVDLPATRAELRGVFGGPEGEEFEEFLREHCFDLHYAPKPGVSPYGFGVGHLWRIATDWPGSPVPPCVHRAPENLPGDPPRLLLIS